MFAQELTQYSSTALTICHNIDTETLTAWPQGLVTQGFCSGRRNLRQYSHQACNLGQNLTKYTSHFRNKLKIIGDKNYRVSEKLPKGWELRAIWTEVFRVHSAYVTKRAKWTFIYLMEKDLSCIQINDVIKKDILNYKTFLMRIMINCFVKLLIYVFLITKSYTLLHSWNASW